MTAEYRKPGGSAGALRLHLNENTGGCSPKVLEALRSMTCTDAAFYHDMSPALRACAQHLGVAEREVILTNGLDEGILCASVAALRGGTYDAIVVLPAFEMYAISAAAAGGRVVQVRQPEDFSFPLERVLAAITAATRIIFLTNPNNPTGLTIPRDDILAIADAAPEALVFVDEAYADFSGTTLIGDVDAARRANIVVGRTFAKAYGLAALRVGALVGTAETMDRIRPVVPPYNVNLAASLALPAALADTAHHQWYVEQAARSKDLLYAAFERWGVPYWRSEANFVLARFGERARRVVDGLEVRGIHVRDRTTEHGCAGCVRITAGVVEHTEQCIRAIEEVL
jgi:histidinol-phosphate aminotransferase